MHHLCCHATMARGDVMTTDCDKTHQLHFLHCCNMPHEILQNLRRIFTATVSHVFYPQHDDLVNTAYVNTRQLHLRTPQLLASVDLFDARCNEVHALRMPMSYIRSRCAQWRGAPHVCSGPAAPRPRVPALRATTQHVSNPFVLDPP